jgi:hypothetical protein
MLRRVLVPVLAANCADTSKVPNFEVTLENAVIAAAKSFCGELLAALDAGCCCLFKLGLKVFHYRLHRYGLISP